MSICRNSSGIVILVIFDNYDFVYFLISEFILLGFNYFVNMDGHQRRILKDIISRSANIIEYGFAFVLSHPEHIPKLNSEMRKIRAVERVMENHPEKSCRCWKVLMESYQKFIQMMCKFSFQYARNHREVLYELMELSLFYNEHDDIRNKLSKKTKDKNDDWIRAVVGDETRNRTMKDKTRNDCNDAVAGTNHEQKTDRVAVDHQEISSDDEILKQIALKLQKLHDRMTSLNLNPHEPKDSTEIIITIEDSDKDSSEYLLKNEDYAMPPLRPFIGPSKRNIVISFGDDPENATTIEPEVNFKRYGNEMQLDLELILKDRNSKRLDRVIVVNKMPSMFVR